MYIHNSCAGQLYSGQASHCKQKWILDQGFMFWAQLFMLSSDSPSEHEEWTHPNHPDQSHPQRSGQIKGVFAYQMPC